MHLLPGRSRGATSRGRRGASGRCRRLPGGSHGNCGKEQHCDQYVADTHWCTSH